MADESTFRFLILRPARARARTSPGRIVVEDDADLRSSPFLAGLRDKRRAVEETRRFRDSGTYPKSLREVSPALDAFVRWATEHATRPLADLDLPQVVEVTFGADLAAFAASPTLRAMSVRLSERILADAVVPSDAGDGDRFIFAKRLLRLVELAARDASVLTAQQVLAQALARFTIVIPDVVEKLPREPAPPMPPRPPADPDQTRVAGRIAALEDARRELVVLSRDSRTIDEGEAPGSPSGTREIGDALETVLQRPMSARAVARVTPAARNLLRELDVAPDEVELETAVGRLDDEIRTLGERLALTESHPTVLLMAGGEVDLKALKSALHPDSLGEAVGPLPAWSAFQNIRYRAGVGDLLIVRQRLKAYELADFAHVENVLAGELRMREHRRLQLREETTTLSTERETQKERDLQSTERNELQTEAEKTIRNQFELDAGAQVSGSYGPSLSFSASLNTSFSTSAEESMSKATSYSREVVERTAEKVRERVTEERQVRTLDQVEEVNKHEINNSLRPDHVRGIYRWLNKIYDAQIFNYGQRMMFEFIVPEPAANYLYAFVDNPPKNSEIRKPSPPTFVAPDTNQSVPLLPGHLTARNYQKYVALYEAAAAPHYPSTFTVVSYFDKHDGTENEDNEAINRAVTRASKIAIPEGYEAYKALVQVSRFAEPDAERERFVTVRIGGRYWRTGESWTAVKGFHAPTRGELAVVIGSYGTAFAVGIDVRCRLTDEAIAKWQVAVYDAIMDGYQRQKSEYDEKVAAAQIQKGIQILGRNPLENRRIEREELKKSIVAMLVGSNHVSRNSFEPGTPPRIDFDRAETNGAFIRFWENAFEWHNILYVFYPYFWGRSARALAAMRLTDPDPEFAAFLKAGAARVQLPVRPGFERAVAHFQQFGKIWMGDDPPLRDDEMYVPVIDEIAENLGKLDDGVPYPAGSQPWEVTIPTSLVVLQDLDEVSGIRDVLTGEQIDLIGSDG